MENTRTQNTRRKESEPSGRWINVRELHPEIAPTRSEVLAAYNSLKARQRAGSDMDVSTVVVPYTTSLAANGSGVVAQVLSNDPNNSSYWSSIYSNYEQYRVLGLRMKYTPILAFGGSSVSTKGPLVVVTDFDSSAALTSYLLAESYSNSKTIPTEKEFTMIAVEEDTNAAAWNDTNTSAPANSFWIKFYSADNSASLLIGRVDIEYIIQLKNRGV